MAGVKRVPLIAGNWKMNLDHLQAVAFVQKLHWTLKDAGHEDGSVEVAVFPPYTDLRTVQTLLDADKIPFALGAQDLSMHDAGAYTGEISGAFLARLGCTYVVVGHSERRQHQAERQQEARQVDRLVADLDRPPGPGHRLGPRDERGVAEPAAAAVVLVDDAAQQGRAAQPEGARHHAVRLGHAGERPELEGAVLQAGLGGRVGQPPDDAHVRHRHRPRQPPGQRRRQGHAQRPPPPVPPPRPRPPPPQPRPGQGQVERAADHVDQPRALRPAHHQAPEPLRHRRPVAPGRLAQK